MAEVKTIKQYRTEQDGNTLIEFPVTDEESKGIIEVNFNQYIDVLSDILVKYAVNFKSGRQWVVPLEYSCAMKSHFRKSGNQMSGKWKSSCASLLA